MRCFCYTHAQVNDFLLASLLLELDIYTIQGAVDSLGLIAHCCPACYHELLRLANMNHFSTLQTLTPS